ncbi:Pyruvate kinase [Rubripirellula tenax]|uniref:Pyruvate kinase n=1 Tax=Rubripirellula tenax TaxID=2528015 RepID=A0A5C6FDD4_9BACT|nr:pyruvate kinase [Rubripirellula tenax]TWU59488.1 Pyruvate kinase [Rubripirellula tenax]
MSRPSIHEACTKIVATVGPACSGVDRLSAMIEAGVDVFRINTAHGSRQEHAQVLADIREASQRVGFHAAVLLDLAGPKIRLGTLVTDPMRCSIGQRVSLIRGDVSTVANELTSSYERLVDELEPGDQVMLADAAVGLRVESVTSDRAECVVVAEGTIRSRQGINLPGVKLSVSALLPDDIDNAIWAAQNGIDLVSLSFVRSAEDVLGLKRLLAEHQSQAIVIAKIEKPEAMENLEEIVDATDGVMVARGDLGVEIDVAETPVAQKRIIRVCKQRATPVIVATQMLESMHHSARPTRAEVSDVANAILDGADACMLSGETAIGEYPIESVRMMNRIMRATERDMLRSRNRAAGRQRQIDTHRVHPITTAVTVAATEIAESIQAKLIVIATRSGNTAWVESQSRSLIPTLGASDSIETLRRMNLLWGIKPVYVNRLDETSTLIDVVCQWGRDHGGLKRGDHIVLVTGTGVIKKAHNLVVVHTVP